ncbi:MULTISPECIES: PstS family phosphate ABC transporter substrate-binding protein [unclassified Pseudomonas]|uniref:PstS family phosphate ABC transporter substrate-binding protein n=1 Tax=unclassified Pseudomonas TaxID=196821 RepID=UPI0025E90239|nr:MULTISPECIES: substrate-binding domain-containing protein [unclassified Pseudomonas]
MKTSSIKYAFGALTVLAVSLSVNAQTLTPPTDAPYLTSDGAIAVIGNDGMGDLMNTLNALFTEQHPGFKFALTAKGSSVGIPALTADATAIAPLSREAWLGDVHGFEQVKGYAPLDIRIGYSGFGPRPPHKTPPAAYVNAANPLPGLTLQDLARIVTTGQPEGDLNTWGQLGVGARSARRIHVYGLRDDGGFATNLRMDKLGGKPFSAKYEALNSREEVIEAVANDPYGIGLTGWVDASRTARNVRVLPLASKAGEPFRSPDYKTVAAGAYPLSAFLHLYIDNPPGRKLPPFLKEYLRLALSDEGQKTLREQRDSAQGYVPLSATDLQAERRKVEGL